MSQTFSMQQLLSASDTFVQRHVGPSAADIQQMLSVLGYETLEALIDDTIPQAIRLAEPLKLPPPRTESEALRDLRAIAEQNKLLRSLIGTGYYGTLTPPIILRNILENPGWYTQYTPYQAEISQGRLEALINYQTMIAELTGMPLSNASLLDEATAAAEAMAMCHRIAKDERNGFYVADDCHPQTIAVIRNRAEPLGIKVHVGPLAKIDYAAQGLFGVLVQYPTTYGVVRDYAALAEQTHAAGALFVVAADLLALALLRAPGEFGADIAVGSAQRFGVPLGGGGPHAGYMATREDYVRQMPGRLSGASKDAQGNPGYRLAVQTREQHIRREKATSNICTAQVLLAIMASMYAVYHGPAGLRRIARRVHALTLVLAAGLRRLGCEIGSEQVFDTLTIPVGKRAVRSVLSRARKQGLNLRDAGDGRVGISLDELSTTEEVAALWQVFADKATVPFSVDDLAGAGTITYPEPFARTSDYLTQPVFNQYHAEHEMLRYLKRLESRDLSLCQSMIPLGSCTMKLNGTAEMLPITWPEFANIHPFAPADQMPGYHELIRQLASWLGEITGFEAASLQPNSGAAGEHTGLLVIRAYHAARGQGQRDVCLIPVSAHGTNPASAMMAGYRVVPVACDPHGNIDLADLKARAEEHREKLAAIMVTYPSTHGVFEEGIKELCRIVHAAGGQVYMDGANMNAQVGLTRPADIGADVCHLNLHKTFCIPHGGGGPGVGPIACAAHLAPFLPGHPLVQTGGSQAIGPVAAAPFGSANILPISWMYIAMMGTAGLMRATQVAILNANYMAHRLREHYELVYSGHHGRVAHEFIIDLREFQKTAHITPEDVAKRLMDYGFHAPTMSWPVAGTLMVEPTESESKAECDRLCDALIAIREEIRAIEQGRLSAEQSPLKHAPHTAAVVSATEWNRAYAREEAAYPAAWVREYKFWPPVGRIDNVWGDRNLHCTCPTVAEVAAAAPTAEPVPV